MRRVLSFGTELFWGIVWTFLILAVGYAGLKLIISRVGGFPGTVATDIKNAVTP